MLAAAHAIGVHAREYARHKGRERARGDTCDMGACPLARSRWFMDDDCTRPQKGRSYTCTRTHTHTRVRHDLLMHTYMRMHVKLLFQLKLASVLAAAAVYMSMLVVWCTLLDRSFVSDALRVCQWLVQLKLASVLAAATTYVSGRVACCALS